MSKVIVVAGPTASGKTALGIRLAKERGGEIVSADSMQIYRGMDIGTAKATGAERAEAVHHMIDIVDPAEDYSVARYVEDAARCCDDILSRGLTPIIVGGTGLYIDSLLSGRDFGDTCPHRQDLADRYDAIGGEEMIRELATFDPDRAAILKPNDKKRIVRAFEVYLATGETITAHDERTKRLPPRYDYEFIFLNPERAELYARINRRVDRMMEEGLVGEVERLLETVPASATSMQAIGYKEIAAYLRGECRLDEAVEQIKLGSRRYAKRQITWFKRYEHF